MSQSGRAEQRLPPLPAQLLPASHAAPQVDLIALDPSVQNANALFTSLGAHQVHEYADIVRRLALGRQDAARGLVSRNYTNLLAVAARVSDMATSVDTLCGTLEGLVVATSRIAENAPVVAKDVQQSQQTDGKDCHAEAAAVLLVAEAPRLADAALRSSQYLSAAWTLLAAEAAWRSLDMTHFSYVAEQFSKLPQIRATVVARAHGSLGDLTRPSVVLQSAAALVLLDGASVEKIVSLFHEHCLGHVRDALKPRNAPPDEAFITAVKALSDIFFRTMDYTSRFFAPHGHTCALQQLLMSNERSEWGMPLLDTTLHTQKNASILEHLSPSVRSLDYELPFNSTPNEGDIAEKCSTWVKCVGAQLHPLETLSIRISDLDTIYKCRSLVEAAISESVHELHILRDSLLGILADRENVLISQTLDHATAKFAQLVDEALEHNEVPEWPRNIAHARPARVQALVSHVEGRMSHARGHRSLPQACDLLAEILHSRTSHKEPASIMHICGALYESETLSMLLQDTPTHMYEKLERAHTEAAKYWAEDQVKNALEKHDTSMVHPGDYTPNYPSESLLRILLSAIRAQRAAGVHGGALPPPSLCAPLLSAWAALPYTKSAQNDWDIAFCSYVLDAAIRSGTAGAEAERAQKALADAGHEPMDSHFARSVPIAAAQLSVTLAPWLRHVPVLRSEASARASGVPLANICTRFVPG